MSDDKTTGKFPKPRVRKLRWPVLLVWIVPILAAIGAGFYFLEYRAERTTEIVIRFSDGRGLKIGQSSVNHLGVEIGKVSDIEFADGQSAVQVHVQLNKAGTVFAKGGTKFWVERAEISAGNISGLTTVISGPYIDALPGDGASQTAFIGLDKAPLVLAPGLRLILHTPRLAHLQRDSLVYYRGIQVGVIQGVELNKDASGVNVHVVIWDRYRNLARSTSEFWIENGIDFSGGLFSGMKLDVESLRAILSGAVAFATPDAKAPAASDLSEFTLNDEPKKEWLGWTGGIAIPPGGSDDADKEESGANQTPKLPTAPQPGLK